MKIEVGEQNEILLTEVYSGVSLKTKDGEVLGICMRDSGFEFNYMGIWYEAKNGVVNKLGGEFEKDIKKQSETPHGVGDKSISEKN